MLILICKDSKVTDNVHKYVNDRVTYKFLSKDSFIEDRFS